MQEFQIEGINMEITGAIKEYINKRLTKLERYEDLITQTRVRCKQSTAQRGVKNDYKVEITIDVPNTLVRVEKIGENLYAVIDEILDIVVRKLERYKGMAREWSRGQLKENFYEELEPTDGTEDQYFSYIPKVSKRITIEARGPMHEAEAIERMELLDQDFYLFQNNTTGKWSVVYKRDDSTYGILEP